MPGFSKDQILVFTSLLQKSDLPLWQRVRELLKERAIDVNSSILVETFPDDNSLEFGVLITKDKKVFQYEFDWLRKDISEGDFSTWRDLTGNFNGTPYDESINIGMSLIK